PWPRAAAPAGPPPGARESGAFGRIGLRRGKRLVHRGLPAGADAVVLRLRCGRAQTGTRLDWYAGVPSTRRTGNTLAQARNAAQPPGNGSPAWALTVRRTKLELTSATPESLSRRSSRKREKCSRSST